MNRKNFQNENSCHDMDVANSQKNAKNFFSHEKAGHGYGAVALASHWTEEQMK